MTTKLILAVLLQAALLVPLAVRGQDQPQAADSPENRLRSALRDTMMQLRDAQNQAVTLQAAQAQSDKDKADLQAKVDALTAQVKTLTDQAVADKAANDKASDDFKAKVADQEGQIGRLSDSLKQWKGAYNQVAELATDKDAQARQLAMQVALLQRTVDERETENLALYKTGMDILTRYERFGLGDAIAAKEPFVGVSRVKLENQVQDYKNKLLDHAVTGGVPSKPPPGSPALIMPPAPVAPASDKSAKTNASAPAKPVNDI